jgi:hypothetical protein
MVFKQLKLADSLLLFKRYQELDFPRSFMGRKEQAWTAPGRARRKLHGRRAGTARAMAIPTSVQLVGLRMALHRAPRSGLWLIPGRPPPGR